MKWGFLMLSVVEPQMVGFLRARAAHGGVGVEFAPEHSRLFGCMKIRGCLYGKARVEQVQLAYHVWCSLVLSTLLT